MRTLSLAALLFGALAVVNPTAASPNGPPKHRPKPPPRPVQQPHRPARGGPGHIPIQPPPRPRPGRHVTHITPPSGGPLAVVPGKPHVFGVKVIYRNTGGGLAGPLLPAPGLPLEYHVEVVPGSGRFTKAFAGTTAANGICVVRYKAPAGLPPGMHRARLQTPGNKQFLPSRIEFVIAAVKPPHSGRGGAPGSTLVKD